MLPDGSGLDVCRDLRAQRSNVPDHSAHRAERGRRPHHRARDRRRRLSRQAVQSARADRPRAGRASPPRRDAAARPSEAKIYRFEGFTADPQTRRVTDPHGGDIELTGAEFDLLKTFLERPGRVLSRDQLLDLTRGRDGDVLDRSIDVLVSRLAPQARRWRRRATVQDGAQRRLSARRQGRGAGRRAMNTLRVKIALLHGDRHRLGGGLLTLVLFALLGPPHRMHSLETGGAADRDAAARRRGGERRSHRSCPSRRRGAA